MSALVSPNHSPVAVFRGLAPQGQSYPMFGVLLLLTVAIGLPFLVVTTHSTLFQRWFDYTGHPSGKDPYFLYAASNAGNLLSLIAYPLVIEPTLTLNQQAWLWAGGFVLLCGLAVACGQMVKYPHRPWVKAKQAVADEPPPSLAAEAPVGRPGLRALQSHARRHLLHDHGHRQPAAACGSSRSACTW